MRGHVPNHSLQRCIHGFPPPDSYKGHGACQHRPKRVKRPKVQQISSQTGTNGPCHKRSAGSRPPARDDPVWKRWRATRMLHKCAPPWPAGGTPVLSTWLRLNPGSAASRLHPGTEWASKGRQVAVTAYGPAWGGPKGCSAEHVRASVGGITALWPLGRHSRGPKSWPRLRRTET